MARKIAQVYYEPSKTTPTKNQLESGSIFEKYMPVVRLGIQSSPNTNTTVFRLNGSANDIKLGYTGIYELDLEGLSQISSLKVIPGEGETVLIDMVYESED